MAKKTLTEHKTEYAEYYFDAEAADRVCRFFERELHHIEGPAAGTRFTLERWQRKILRRFFGWKHRETGLRKYKTLYIEIPRKNGKSALGSGLALYLLDADREMGAQVVSAAGETEQASIIFRTAKEMVQANPKLFRRIKCYRKSMAVLSTASSYKVLSADADTKHGANLSGIIVDELHVQPNRDLVDVLITSTAYRSQPVTALLTTAGYDKNSICWEYHDYALKTRESVRDGGICDPSFLGVIFAADPDDDWTDPKVWAKANPNLGVTVRLDYLEAECQRAKNIPAYENTFKRLHLNIWTEQDSRWIPIEKWDECKKEIHEDDLYGRECWLGIDLAATTDMTAVVALFPFEDGSLVVKPWYWVPEEVIPLRKKADRVPYDEWVKMGQVFKTPGAVTDYDAIRAFINNELHAKYRIVEIGADRWNALQLCTQLQGDGFTVVFVNQTFASLTDASKQLSGLILSKRLHHDGHRVLRWNAKNVAVEQDGPGNIKPSKKKSKERIDGIAALVNALARYLVKDESGPSVYESRGILTL